MNFLKSNEPLLIVIGPSGSGKSSVVQELAKRGVVEVTPSWTTRPPRNGEVTSSIEHKFVGEEEFDKKQSDDFFLEVVQLFNLPYRYGLPKIKRPQKVKIPLIMLRAILLPLVPKHYTNYKVYQIEDELPKVKERLLKRQAEGENQGTRLDDYEKEVEAGKKLANRVFVNDSNLEQLAANIEMAIQEDFKQ